MASAHLEYVSQNPPRCVAHLHPIFTQHSKPTLFLSSECSVYRHGGYNVEDIVSFVIGCPCGERAVYLSAYNVKTDVFVSPLSIECCACGRISEFFDTRKHGYDGEQGVNTHMVGKGNPERFGCPLCGVAPMFLSPNFCYQGIEDLRHDMRERLQDFFSGLDVVGQCTSCNQVVEIASFECA